MIFNAHGELGIKWNGNMLMVYPTGEINLEGVRQFHKLVNKEIENAKYETFSRIIEYSDNACLATLEAYEEFQGHVIDNLNRGCCYIGIVGGNAVSRHYLNKILVDTNCPHDFFSTSVLAIKYMSENIAGVIVEKT
ncbi:MAG: hypothetical protein V7785_16600 [Bermanella sp.]